jgi:hypothetical protein
MGLTGENGYPILPLCQRRSAIPPMSEKLSSWRSIGQPPSVRNTNMKRTGMLEAEQKRLKEAVQKHWRRWGPYVSERQWGTVREDYSADGAAWEYFPHEHARSRAYRWGEDGIAGISDRSQRLCLALALWNGKDPILKERLFGLTNAEGNHGEDVKEIYYYLDATPTHSYLKMLYKYPQQEFPYQQLREENARRGRDEPEFELLDTGIFDEDRYYDVFVEYAKADPEDILMRVTLHNRGGEAATVHVLPQLWFRNTWSWKTGRKSLNSPQPATARLWPSTRRSGHIIFTVMAPLPCSSARTRRIPSGSPEKGRRVISKTGSMNISWAKMPRPSIQTAAGPKPPRITKWLCRGATQ